MSKCEICGKEGVCWQEIKGNSVLCEPVHKLDWVNSDGRQVVVEKFIKWNIHECFKKASKNKIKIFKRTKPVILEENITCNLCNKKLKKIQTVSGKIFLTSDGRFPHSCTTKKFMYCKRCNKKVNIRISNNNVHMYEENGDYHTCNPKEVIEFKKI